jgi:Alg9-like mannosyltransferase family
VHNGGLAFNLALLLALALPLLAALQHLSRRASSMVFQTQPAANGPGADARLSARQEGRMGRSVPPGGALRARLQGVAALAPLWLWLATISLLPHKEERFLYVVYPLVSPVQNPLPLQAGR